MCIVRDESEYINSSMSEIIGLTQHREINGVVCSVKVKYIGLNITLVCSTAEGSSLPSIEELRLAYDGGGVKERLVDRQDGDHHAEENEWQTL
jgi:hypothetical protein